MSSPCVILRFSRRIDTQGFDTQGFDTQTYGLHSTTGRFALNQRELVGSDDIAAEDDECGMFQDLKVAARVGAIHH